MEHDETSAVVTRCKCQRTTEEKKTNLKKKKNKTISILRNKKVSLTEFITALWLTLLEGI